jgi:hypothetical protein
MNERPVSREPFTVNRADSASSASAPPTLHLISPFTVHDSRFTSPAAQPPATTSARRALDPPETVDVVCDGETPCVVTWRGQRIAITRALGPERLSGDWWDDGYRRDYWRCESVAGDLTVYWDRSDASWRLQNWRD